MAEEKFGITQFVRGMAWHDAGKPFVIDTGKHAALGYWLLQLAGYRGEAKVALAHGNSSRNKTLRDYLQSGGEPLPAVLLLCNALDVLSASVYSFQSRLKNKRLETDYHTWQNPFSRLVIHSTDLMRHKNNDRFVVATSVASSTPTATEPTTPSRQDVCGRSPGIAFAVHHEERVDKLYTPLRENFARRLPASWQGIVTPNSMEEATTISPETIKISPLPDVDQNRKAIEIIEQFLGHYPERTYPSVNDTSLLRHCRLSGILAFVVYRNLERGTDKHWLGSSLTLEDGHLKRPAGDEKQIVRKHLVANLVRIAFEGHRALYENAIRVDDLHGARELTEWTQEAFKQTLANKLDVPDLAEFLTISESQFDLIYLLPPLKTSLEIIVHDAYEAAMSQVTKEITGRLKRDFPQIAAYQSQLGQQLGDIGYGLRIVPVEMPEETEFNPFAAQYGHNLLKAYLECLAYATFPWACLRGEGDWRNSVEPLAAADTCEVCGNYPVLVPPAGLGAEAQAEWLEKRDYAAHIFRGEREQICLSCVARRTLAYGRIAKKMDSVVHPMLTPVESQPSVWQSVRPPNGPDLPPSLASTVSLDYDYELRDVGAFYVRYRRVGDQIDHSALDVFPTTSYAADATGNVVMLSLQPTEALFSCYPYDAAIIEFDPEQQPGDSHIDSHVALWQETFIRYHHQVAGEVEAKRAKGEQSLDLSEPIRHVQPHLARVMERIQRIQIFYDDLHHRLVEGPSRLRVLPLGTAYPTLRLLLPADQLDQALSILDRVMTESLFSATPPETPQEREALHHLLALLVPDLLHGAVVLFKQKFPLYLALEAERHLFHQLAATDERRETSDRPSHSGWYGLRLAFTDLRGTLSQVGPKHAEVNYANLGQVLDLADPARGLDRRTVLLHAEAARYISPELANALMVVRADRIDRGQDKVQALKREQLSLPVLFLKRATRR